MLFWCHFYPCFFRSEKGIWELKKSITLTKRAWIENSKTRERSPLRAKKVQKRAKNTETALFWANPCFLGKKHGKGDQGFLTQNEQLQGRYTVESAKKPSFLAISGSSDYACLSVHVGCLSIMSRGIPCQTEDAFHHISGGGNSLKNQLYCMQRILRV